MKTTEMEVVEMDIEKIIPYINNPRRNDDSVDLVASSIHEYGFRQPIVVDKDNIIIVGHTRYKAALKLGLKTVPVSVADDLTPAQVKAYRIADNKVGERSTWDNASLKVELEELKEEDIDLSLVGFSEEELAMLYTDISEEEIDSFFHEAARRAAEDDEPKEPKRVQCPHCGEWFDVE